MSRSFVVLVNPASAGGRALQALPRVEAELERLGAPYRTVETSSIDHAATTAEEATAAGETVAAMGGDGLLRPLAGVLSGGESAVALIPCGRGNDFARVLGVPKDPVEAARIAVQGEERLVDVASVDGVPFVGIASFGFDSDANRIANEARLIKGKLVYLYAALRALVAWKPARFTVDVDGTRHRFAGYTVAVGNSKAYGGGMFLLPQAELDDGRLDVLLVLHTGKLRFLQCMPKVFKGAHVDLPYTVFLKGSEVRVDADRPFDIYADGDPIGRTPATITVSARVLRVIVPAAS
ncbi:MAG TPA: diacylglycerol kinase family protein [Thermoleophilaceae bacterium]